MKYFRNIIETIRILIILPLFVISIFSCFSLIVELVKFKDITYIIMLLVFSFLSLTISFLFIKIIQNNSYLIESKTKIESLLKNTLSSIYLLLGIALIYFFFRNIYGILFNSTTVIDGTRLRLEFVSLYDYTYLIIGFLIILDIYSLTIKKRKDKNKDINILDSPLD